MDLKKDEKEIKNFFDKFSYDFSLFKKIIFLFFFILTLVAFGYWCYMVYKIYTDNDPMFMNHEEAIFQKIDPNWNKKYNIPLPTSTWSDLYHYDLHLLAAFQATVLGAFMCIIITVAL